MTTRYFKATDGTNTYFRASPSQTYASLTGFEPGRYSYSFHRDGRGRHPAVEITRQEYKALGELKLARFARMRADWIAANPDKPVRESWFEGTAPSDSWVRNDAIHEAEGLARLTAQSMLSREGRIAANGGYDPLGDMPEGV